MADDESCLAKLNRELLNFSYNGETTVNNSEVTTFAWGLKNFSEIEKYKKNLKSSKLSLRDDPTVQFSIGIQFYKNYLETSIKLFTDRQTGRMFEADFYILNNNMERVCRSTLRQLLANGVENNISCYLQLPCRLTNYNSGALIVCCDIWSKNFLFSFKSNVLTIPKSELCKDFSSLFNDQSFNDFTVVCKDKEFAVHRAILAKRSKVFSAMIQHEMLENKTSKVTIGNSEPEVVRELLRFIYTDNVVSIEKFALQLLELADRFDLQRLKVICANELVKSIDAAAALQILVIADRHKIRDLEEFTLNFIKYRLGEIVASDDYDTFCKNHPDLLEKILRRMV